MADVELWGSAVRTTKSDSTDPFPISLPSSIGAGMLILIAVAAEHNTHEPCGSTSMSGDGFTGDGGHGGGLRDTWVAWYWKIADGDEGGTTVDLNINDLVPGTHVVATAYVFANVDSTTPIIQEPSTMSDSSAPFTVPANTATADGSMAVYNLAFDGGDATLEATEAGWTHLDPLAADDGAAASVTQVTGYTSVNTGSTGTVAVVLNAGNNDGAYANMFIVNPGSSGPPVESSGSPWNRNVDGGLELRSGG